MKEEMCRWAFCVFVTEGTETVDASVGREASGTAVAQGAVADAGPLPL